MYSSEQARYDWCIKYCEENNLDLTYYRDWEVAEEAFEKSIKDFHEEIYKLYKETIKRHRFRSCKKSKHALRNRKMVGWYVN